MVMSEHEILFDQDQIDYFQELINIAFGRAAGLLHDFTGHDIHLHIPEVKFESYSDFFTKLEARLTNETVISQQNFNGQIAGETLLILNRGSAKTLAKILHQIPEPTNKDIISAAYDVGNIITTSSTKVLADISNLPMSFSTPVAEIIQKHDLLAHLNIQKYESVVTITTILDIPDANIHSEVHYLFKKPSLRILAESLSF